MKQTLILCAALLACRAFALDDIPLPPSGDFYGPGGGGGATTVNSLVSLGTVDGVPVEASVPVDTVATAVDSYAQIVKKVVTVLPQTVILEDGKADGNGVKILDVQEGAFLLLSAVADMTVVSNNAFNETANDVFYASCGTAAAADGNGDLTSTEADVVPKTTIDTASSGSLTNAFNAVLAAPAVFDGTTTAKDVYVNFAVADASTSQAVTNVVSGTLTLYLLHAGDY